MPSVRLIKAKQIKKKVAAYARVSTLMEEQEESYETQRNYYEAFIRQNPDWEFAGIYADRGISGTSARKRQEFLRMIKSARAGEINLILCKYRVCQIRRNQPHPVQVHLQILQKCC